MRLYAAWLQILFDQLAAKRATEQHKLAKCFAVLHVGAAHKLADGLGRIIVLDLTPWQPGLRFQTTAA